jgi:hypothetical protein
MEIMIILVEVITLMNHNIYNTTKITLTIRQCSSGYNAPLKINEITLINHKIS